MLSSEYVDFWPKIYCLYSVINMRQLQILFNQTKICHRIVCFFSCFYQFLQDVIIKLFCKSKQNNFWSHHARTGKNRKTRNIFQTFALPTEAFADTCPYCSAVLKPIKFLILYILNAVHSIKLHWEGKLFQIICRNLIPSNKLTWRLSKKGEQMRFLYDQLKYQFCK